MRLNDQEAKEFSRYLSFFDFADFFKGRTVLVTGANGMTGQAIIKWLLLLGGCKVFASTRTPSMPPSYFEQTDDIRFVKFGEEGLIKGNIDFIFHAASPTQRSFFVENPVETIETIVNGTSNILKLAKLKAATVVFLSSCEVYGAANSPEPLREDFVGAIDSMNARSSYPLSKKEAELLCYAYHKEFGVDIRIVRISAIQGLYQSYDSQRVESEILRCVLESKNLVMKSDGQTKKSFVYTLDVVSGLFVALARGSAGDIYNLTNNDTFMTIVDLAQTVFSLFNPKCQVVFSSSPNAGFLGHLSYTQDTTKLRRIGWRPITSLAEIYKIDIERFGG